MAARRITLTDHPRLYLSADALKNAARNDGPDFLQDCVAFVEKQADVFRRDPDFQALHAGHNAHLIRARTMQTRIVTLLVAWLRTGKASYRDSVLAHTKTLGEWEYWSWITWRESNADPLAIFDLSYGENSATLAIVYDVLYDTLSDSERDTLITFARERSLKSFLKHTTPGQEMWWFGKPDTNWNTVCAGGAGMLALAMYEDLPEARQALPRSEKSIKPYMDILDETRGGWPEGIGYWNYGMRYAFMYLLSHENATGRKHPMLRKASVKSTLSFPLDFCPNGRPCSFGDANGFSPLAMHYAVAQQLGATDVIASLDHFLDKRGTNSVQSWPNQAELLMLHPRKQSKAKPKKNHVQLYKGLDWGVMADQSPDPSLYIAARGGTTEVPHVHIDLTSFYCVAGDEIMIENIGAGQYLDTTFSPRRFEMPEMNALSKNVLLLNGLGIGKPATVKTSVIDHGKFKGFRYEATEALATNRGGRNAVKSYQRAILSMGWQAILVVDAITLSHIGLIETRLHTKADVSQQKAGFKLKKGKQRMTVACASTVDSTAHTAVLAHTQPSQQANVLRWVSDKLHLDVVTATLLVPGAGSAKVALGVDGRTISVHAQGRDWSQTVKLTKTLNLSK